MSDTLFRVVGGSIYVHSVPSSGGSIYVHGAGQNGAGLLSDGWKKLKGIGKDIIKELKSKAKEGAKEKAKIVADNLMDKYLSEDKRFYLEKAFPKLKIDKSTPSQKAIVKKIEEAHKKAGEDPDEIERRANLFKPMPKTVGLGLEGDEEFKSAFKKVVKPKPKRKMTEAQLENLRRGREIRAQQLAQKKSILN